MTKHTTGTHKEWLAARLDLLQAEKEHTRRGDKLAQQRQALPWVRIDKEYRFDTDQGSATLLDLFKGRSQLIVYHFMFGADYKAGCPSCSAIADGFNASSFGSDFNLDFQVGITEEQQRTGIGEYNFQKQDERAALEAGKLGIGAQIAAGVGTDWPTFWRERPGMSAFVLDGGVVYHTYSAYARGLDGLWGMYQWLDRAPLGRNESGLWWRRHDEYDQR